MKSKCDDKLRVIAKAAGMATSTLYAELASLKRAAFHTSSDSSMA